MTSARTSSWVKPVAVEHTATRDHIEIQVRLVAVGHIEPGWDWGEHALTAVDNFMALPAARMDTPQPSHPAMKQSAASDSGLTSVRRGRECTKA